MRLRKIGRGLAVLVLSAMVCIGFTAVKDGYDLYREAVGEISLADKVSEIQAVEGYTELSDLPETYVDAVVSVEDHRFYNHIGIDFIAICRAVVNDIKAGRYVEGGSTITQQLAKNLYFTHEKKMERKIAEVFLAFDLEDRYSKDEILELYVNSIYFGDGYDNVGQASAGYFGKAPEEMSLYESTMLAGVPNAPSKYAPTKNPELAEQRRKQVVRRMVANGCYTGEPEQTDVAPLMAAKVVALNP